MDDTATLSVLYPVQGRIGEDSVERFGKIEACGIGQNEREIGKVFASVGQHVRRVIETDNISAAFAISAASWPVPQPRSRIRWPG